MLVEKHIFNKILSQSYQKKIEELEIEYSAIFDTDFNAKKECLFEFSQNYFMITELWDEYFRILDEIFKAENNIANFHLIGFGLYLARKQLYSNRGDPFTKLLHRDWKDYSGEIFIEYEKIHSIFIAPFKGIEKAWRFYNKYSPKPLPKEAFLLYKEAKELYSNIIKSENDTEKWAHFISQAKDIEYVENNFEYKIGKNLNNQKLWKLYLQYLEKNDSKKLLCMYASYCRYFLDDLEMKNAYKKAVEQFGPSEVDWKNPFSFEIFKEDSYEPQCPPSPQLKNEPKMITSKISTNIYDSQIFSLPKTIILYLLEKGNPKIIHQLHKSCKLFFIIFPYPVYHRLDIICGISTARDTPDYIDFFQQAAQISIAPWYGVENRRHAGFTFKHNIIISNALKCVIPKRDALKITISYTFRCCAKVINIRDQDLTFKEFKFLTEEGNVESLMLGDTHIVNEKNEEVELANILRLTPKLIDLRFINSEINENIFENLIEINFQSKFVQFTIKSMTKCNPHGIVEFIKRNIDQNSEFFIFFDDAVNLEMEDYIVEYVKKELTLYWTNKNEQPYIAFHFSGGHRRNYEIFDKKYCAD